METVTLFIDTNGFIQLNELKAIPWRDMFPRVNHVKIMVSRPVIEELDEFKTSTNARRRDRARLALKLIDQASQEPDHTLSLKDKPFKVSLIIAPRLKPNWESLQELDPASPDDQLVAAAITHGDNAMILSHDSGPRISARMAGLTALEPKESWLLPPEQTDDQKKVGRLERELKQALEKHPRVEIEFHGADADRKIVLYMPKLPKLEQSIADRLAAHYIGINPMRNVRADIGIYGREMAALMGGGYSVDDVQNYQHEYNAFEKCVQDYFATLHERIARVAQAPQIRFDLFNSGNASAIQLVVTLEVNGAIGMLPNEDGVSGMVGTLELPNPPEAPRRRQFDDFLNRNSASSELWPRLDHMRGREERDPTKLKWLQRPVAGGMYGTYGCEDFRPHRRIEDKLWLRPQGKLPVVGTLTVSASANHLASVSETLEIRIEEREETWTDDTVLARLPHLVRQELAKG